MTEKPCPCGWSHASDVMESRVSGLIKKHEAEQTDRLLRQLGQELQQLPGWQTAWRNCQRYLKEQAGYQEALAAAQCGKMGV